MIGIVACVFFLIFLTACLIFIGMYGGFEFGPLEKKELTWFVPACLFVIGLWWLLFRYSGINQWH